MVAHAISVHQIACDAGDWDVSSQMSISDCIPVTRETFHKLVFAAVCCKHAVSIRPVFVIDPILRHEDEFQAEPTKPEESERERERDLHDCISIGEKLPSEILTGCSECKDYLSREV